MGSRNNIEKERDSFRTFFMDVSNCSHHGSIGMVFANEEWILNLGSVVWLVETRERTQLGLVDRYGIVMKDVLRQKKDVEQASLAEEY